MKPYQREKTFFACGHPVVLRMVEGETHAFSPEGERLSTEDLSYGTVYGGGEGLELKEVSLTQESGFLQAVYGGGIGDTVDSVTIRVTGGVVRDRYVGGGRAAKVGTVRMIFEDVAAMRVITGSEWEGAEVFGDAELVMENGVVLNLQCGGGVVTGNVRITVRGGRLEKQIVDSGVQGRIELSLPENLFVLNSKGGTFPHLPENAVLTLTPPIPYEEIAIYPENEDEFYRREEDRGEIRFFELRDPNLKKEDSPFPQFIGDCILITLPDQKAMLIDTGLPYNREELISGLEKLGVRSLDYLVLTHFHVDHMGNLSSLLQEISIDTVVLPDVFCTPESGLLEPVLELMRRAYEGRQTVRRVAKGDAFSLGEASFEVLNPAFPGYCDLKLNNTSIVLKMTLWGKTVLFTGDIGEEVELRLVEEYGEDLKCDVLKLSHHGIVYQNHYRFIDACRPRFAVVQNLRENGVFMKITRYALEKVNRLPRESFFFTGRDGAMKLTLSRKGEISLWRQFDPTGGEKREEKNS